MRKNCAQIVLGVWMRPVGKSLRKCAECIRGRFYTGCTTFMRRAIHSLFSTFSFVSQTLIPTIHTPYKEQKYLTLNILVLSLSGELL